MTPLHRLVQLQIGDSYEKRATSTPENAEALEKLLEKHKPRQLNPAWDLLIATPFRYPLPTNPAYPARFRPPHFHRNSWYGSFTQSGAIYEFSFHLLRQRVHLELEKETGQRTLFSVECNLDQTWDLRGHDEISEIMDRENYLKSHEIAKSADSYSGLIYPSCRAPGGDSCAVIYEIDTFQKTILTELTVSYTYEAQTVTWVRHPQLQATVHWKDVH